MFPAWPPKVSIVLPTAAAAWAYAFPGRSFLKSVFKQVFIVAITLWLDVRKSEPLNIIKLHENGRMPHEMKHKDFMSDLLPEAGLGARLRHLRDFTSSSQVSLCSPPKANEHSAGQRSGRGGSQSLIMHANKWIISPASPCTSADDRGPLGRYIGAAWCVLIT